MLRDLGRGMRPGRWRLGLGELEEGLFQGACVQGAMRKGRTGREMGPEGRLSGEAEVGAAGVWAEGVWAEEV